MARGIFPQLNVKEVTDALAGWGFSVSPEQLHRPTPDFVESVYCACLQQATNLNHDTLRGPVHNALNASQVEDEIGSIRIRSSEQYHGLPPVIRYRLPIYSADRTYCSARVARAARVDDFSSRDLYNPERERTLVLISAFINFVKFGEQYCDEFIKGLRERSDALVIQRNNLADQIEDIQAKFDDLSARIAQDKPICEKLNQENTALTSTMFLTKDAQAKAVRDVEQFKADRTELVNRKEALNGEIKSLEEAITRTRGRIVQSPERIKKTITIMSHTAMEDKKTVAMHEAKARDLQAKVNALHNIEKVGSFFCGTCDVRGCIEQIQTIDREARSLDVSQKSLRELRDLLNERIIERNELQLRQKVAIFRVEEQFSNAKTKFERAQRLMEDKKQASQNTLERLQKEYEDMVEQRRENDKQIEEVRDEVNRIETKVLLCLMS
ncbi:hypothetical protein CVT26_009836 [Gymnopilus dilepis]|uniref:Uncharacterized protein n=1 Tax=Gymnopilus dilepis TaxID=231916 RepID=A0A409VL05_9AGAR|nr:hypothetical protein CVT26_009836 [Gymnopilus dilepis]